MWRQQGWPPAQNRSRLRLGVFDRHHPRMLCIGATRGLLQRVVRARAVQAMTTAAVRLYTLKPLPKFGAEVTGIDLKEDQPQAMVQAIQDDVTK